MKIAYLGGGLDVPAIRFRLPFLKLLRQRGHQVDLMWSHPSRYESYRWLGWRLSQSIKRFVRHWHSVRIRWNDYDVVVLESGLFHSNDYAIETSIRKSARRFVYDFDDALFLDFPEKTQALTRMADHVIVANRNLELWARDYSNNVSIIPTCVDAELYTPKPAGTHASNQDATRRTVAQHSSRTKPVIGWIGSKGNLRMLTVCADALRRLAQTEPYTLQLVVARDADRDLVDLRGVDTEWVDIDRGDVIEQLHGFDIGIMPLPDEPWMQYKCNAKMIQYMAVGIPAVGSAVGFNFELIQPDQNGMLAADTDEWVRVLTKLLRSPSLRQQLGAAGRETVLARFTVQQRIDEYERILQGG